VLLQPKLNLKVAQRQVLTPGLVQMVSVLALNKLELKDMINSEMIENPVLEELEESSASIHELHGQEGDRDRSVEEVASEKAREEKDPFDEIDFGSYFQDYLDPGFKTASNFEEFDKPSFEHFLSQPTTLSEHIQWQLGSLNLTLELRLATELIIGNLDDNGYLAASDEELAEAFLAAIKAATPPAPIPFERGLHHDRLPLHHPFGSHPLDEPSQPGTRDAVPASSETGVFRMSVGPATGLRAFNAISSAREIIQELDPAGVGARDLRECLQLQIAALRREAANAQRRRASFAHLYPETAAAGSAVQDALYATACHIVQHCLPLLQKRDMRELTRHCGRSADDVNAAVDFIRTLDPRPGQRYNQSETRLIEPDVAFTKRDGEWIVLMNEEDMPALRLNQGYRRMLKGKTTEKEVREYVKERYKSAIQLLRNIEQRKNTIMRTCESIIRRQIEFLEHGEQALKPMMIKEVAEEIGVHPSTVSRAVANKYVHTTQGVYELRFFFSEGVNGPEGVDLPLVLLKRKVKKLIEDEDARKPLTDDQLAAALKAQGINVTRRTVAKYREDLQIPSTHQRRVR
jgi:RNA polymerase sigma-54 factor